MDFQKNIRISELMKVGRMNKENLHPGNYINGLFVFIQNYISLESIVCEVVSFGGMSSDIKDFC